MKLLWKKKFMTDLFFVKQLKKMSQMFIISIYFAQTSFKRPLVLEDHIFVFAIGMISVQLFNSMEYNSYF